VMPVGNRKAPRPEHRPQSAPPMHTFEPRTFRAQRGLGDARLEAFALNVLADVELRSGDTKASCAS
jgi:hypothetical protein